MVFVVGKASRLADLEQKIDRLSSLIVTQRLIWFCFLIVSESPDSGELKIVRMDKYSGYCTGNEEVFLLCEKVNKKDIKIRFFETDSNSNQTWESYATFTEADVHHQVAIVFRTPAYHDLNIETPVQVFAQLFRPKDGEYSEPRPFTFKPKNLDTESIEKKRKKSLHFNSNYCDDYPIYTDCDRIYNTAPIINPAISTNHGMDGLYFTK